MIPAAVRRQGVVVFAVLSVAIAAASAWLRAEDVEDDRGSDSSEKAFMVVLAIALGGAVTAAAIAFVNSKTALFR